MWINLVGKDTNGDTTFVSGAYNADSAILINDTQLKVYQIIQGLTQARASAYGLSAGPSFHFALNDTILFDNRIPPKGFTNLGFQQRLAQPVAVAYANNQYWDTTQYILPATTSEVTATLYYQTISKEYIDFLRDQNIGNTYDSMQYGERLDSSWNVHGKSQPVVMTTQTVPVQPSTGVGESQANLPKRFELLQNYPNPFNPTTKVSFVIGSARGGSFVSLKVIDLLGREVRTLVNETKVPGKYDVVFDAANLPSGMYFYSLTAGNIHLIRKMVLIK
jgi:hypothetical protein